MAEACDGSVSGGRGALSSVVHLARTSHTTAGTRSAGSDPGAADSQEIASAEIDSLGVDSLRVRSLAVRSLELGLLEIDSLGGRSLEAATSSSGTSVVKFASDASLALAFTPRGGWCERGVAGF
jgi:hypothetical protein